MYSYKYVADDGETVTIPRSINPFAELSVSEGDSIVAIKTAFKERAKTGNCRERALASLAYSMITSKHQSRYQRTFNNLFCVKEEDIFVFAAIGHTQKLLSSLSRCSSTSVVTAVNEHNHTLLYLAARSGFYGMTKALLDRGCPINAKQVNDSTALHAASFFGQTEIVKLLLEHGADPSIKNKWNSTPEDEAENDDIKELFRIAREAAENSDDIKELFRPTDAAEADTDYIGKLAESLKKSNKLSGEVQPRYYNGNIVGQELCLRVNLDPTWEIAWHGTKYDSLKSICLYGLKPSGTVIPIGKEASTQPGHYELGDAYFGVEDWARAIFVSPSILYAAHICYAERITSLSKRWAVVVSVRVKPTSYTTHNPTTSKTHVPIHGEPDVPEYRIPATELEKSTAEDDKFLRSFSIPEVAVRSVMFVEVDFLEKIDSEPDMTYEKIKEIFE